MYLHRILTRSPSNLKGEELTDKILILVTSSNRRECRKIAKHLVEKRWAACVNITSPVRSIYRWEGKVEEAREFVLLLKSTRQLFPTIRKAIIKLHSYKVPEVICLPILDGSQAFLHWIDESVKHPGGADVIPGEEPEM